MIQILVFVTGSAVLTWYSRKNLIRRGAHGFYRFFAWEFILGLVVLNLPAWGTAPLSWHEIISWLLLLLSIFLVIHGVYLLRRLGNPSEDRGDSKLYWWEKTTRLVTAGAYKYIRHPMYASLLCVAWGVFFQDPSWLGFSFGAVATVFLMLTAKADENECIRYFGAEYEAYMRRTKRFVPFVI
jgi:protein-S-isoprenylcysteine O-methyltransferase Ste14